MASKKVTVHNPRRKTTKAQTYAKPRRRRRRRNPSMHPALKAGLGTIAGAAGGAGMGLGLRYTSLGVGSRSLIEGLGGLALGVGLSFVDPVLGAGVGGGMASVGLLDGVAYFMSKPSDAETASETDAAGVYYMRSGMAYRPQMGAVDYPAALGMGAVEYNLDAEVAKVMQGA